MPLPKNVVEAISREDLRLYSELHRVECPCPAIIKHTCRKCNKGEDVQSIRMLSSRLQDHVIKTLLLSDHKSNAPHLLIVRQTLGWQSGKGRKKRDWMSQKQLMARTGRNSAILSAALDALVQGNLIVCQTEHGEPLVTPQQGRNHRGRVYLSVVEHNFARPKQSKPNKQERENARLSVTFKGKM